jgi:hypothetical protein
MTFLDVSCTGAQSSASKFDNVCVTSLLFLFMPLNILKVTSEMHAKIHIKYNYFGLILTGNELVQQPAVKFFQYEM